MIHIDLENGDTGEMGGDAITLSTEVTTVIMTYYNMLIEKNPKNHDVFFEQVKSAVKEAGKLNRDKKN